MNKFIFAVASLCIYSCTGSGKINKNANKVHLSRIISWTDSAPSRNIRINDFIYDDQKRLVEITLDNGDSVNNEIKISNHFSYKLVYKGTDRHPYRSISPFYRSLDTELFHFYNTDGILIRDSTVSPLIHKCVHTVSYMYDTSAGRIIGVNSYKFDSVARFKSRTEFTYDSFTVADHNITGAFHNFWPGNKEVSGYRITYDNKVNPVSKLNIANATVVSGPIYVASFLAAGFCKNNITEYTLGTSKGPGDFTVKHFTRYKYAYNKNGLPDMCYFTNEDFSGKIKYYYTE